MKSRRKSLPVEGSGLGTSQSQTGTPLRQMTITESFKNTKPKLFKMEKPFHVSSVSIVIDSDSDEETPPQFECSVEIKTENKPVILKHNETTDETMDAPSPPKKPRTMIGVYKPDIFTPKKKENASPITPKFSTIGSPGVYKPDTFTPKKKDNASPITPKFSTIGSASTSNEPSLNLSTGSNSSGKTIRYSYPITSNCWDEPTVQFPTSIESVLPSNTSGKEFLVMNYEENALDAFSLPQNNHTQTKPSLTEANTEKSPAAKRLDFNITRNNKATTKKERKSKKNKTAELVKDFQNCSAAKNSTNNINNTPNNKTASKKDKKQRILNKNKATESVKDIQKSSAAKNSTDNTRKRRKRKNDAEKTSNSTVKENSSPEQNPSCSAKKVVIRKVTTLTPPLRSSANGQQSSIQNMSSSVVTTDSRISVEGSANFPMTAAETIKKSPVDNTVLKKAGNLSDIIDKLRTNKELSVQLTNTDDTPPSTPRKKAVSIVKVTSTALTSTGWIGKTANLNNSGTRSRNLSSSDKGQPSCSKSLGENSSRIKENISLASQDASVHKDKATDATKVPFTTPEKQKMGPNTPRKNGSSRRNLDRSPSKSPNKNREIKTLKSKEGKVLQVRQMDELAKLFQIAQANRHLRALLNGNEREILRKFGEMEDNKKYFLMKLFVWQRLWYNIFTFCAKANIEFDDEKDIVDIFEYLREEGFVDTDYKTSATLPELLNILDRFKVKEIMEERRIKPIRSKTENIKTILAAAGRQATLTTKTFKDLILDSIEKKMGFAIKIKEDVYNAFYNVCLLATFSNPQFYKIEDYFNHVIYNRVVFPETPVEDYPVFYSREKFLSYGQALKMWTELEDQITNPNKESKSLEAVYQYMRAYETNLLTALKNNTRVDAVYADFSKAFDRVVVSFGVFFGPGYLVGKLLCGQKSTGIYNIAEKAYGQLLNLDTDDVNDHSEAPHLKKFTAQHVYTGILSSCCDKIFSKQNGYPSDVRKWLKFLIKKFPNSRRLGKWYEILIKLHMRHLSQIDYESAAKVVIEALDTRRLALGEIAIYDLGALGDQVKSSRRHRIDQIYHDRVTQLIPRPVDTQSFPQRQIDSQCIRSDDPGKKRDYILKSNFGLIVRGVEEVAREHYAENGYPGGVHCEGSIVTALLVLFFWDIIYNPTKVITGTFISKLQTAPLDMSTPHFYKNRKDLIDKRLEEIASGWSEEKLLLFAVDNWRNHSFERAAFGEVKDTIKDEPTVEVLITVIRRKVLSKIFERLIKNIRGFRSGMPDLLVWNVDKKECKFVEVKGQGDRLSTGQKLWLQYLQQSAASIEVCWVHSMGSKRKKIKKVSAEHEPQEDEAGPSSKPD